MNYIYDIYLNLNKNLYDFFDWNINDNLIHIKKIPIIKVKHDKFVSCIENKIKINRTLLNLIINKTSIYSCTSKYLNCLLISDSNNIIAVEFDNDGKSIRKSYLMIDEELEVLDTIYKNKESDFEIEILKKEKKIFKTRQQTNEKKFINNELNTISKDKLDYIFFECFGKKEKDKEKILKEIKNISENSKIYKSLYNILKLTATEKNKMV